MTTSWGAIAMADSPLNLSREVEDLFRAKMGEFFSFCAQHWQMTEADMAEAKRTPQWAEGWNAAVEALPTALDTWLEEHPI